MTIGTLITLLGALGAGSIVTLLAKTIVERVTGRTEREQTAWEQRDREARARRQLEEYAYTLRTFCHLKHGTDYKDLPTWPDCPK